MSRGIVYEQRERVAYVTLDRPERLNALGADMTEALIAHFDAIDRDPDVWAVLLGAAGDRAFCSGVDLKEVNAGEFVRPMKGPGRNVFETVYECGKPVVAALNGWALGAGFELALACDLRIAADRARLGMPEARRGMGGNFGAQLLARALPPARAYELLYLGDDIGADQALDWGLVNRVVPGAELDVEAERLVRVLVANAPLSTQRYKAVISLGRDLPLATALRLDPRPDPYESADRAEGVAAFVEHRTPRWVGR
jgi:enoyl-CoA hydratase